MAAPSYIAFTKHPPGSKHSDIVVTASYDHGPSWKEPVIATPSDSIIYFQPNLAVDDRGQVGISAFALAPRTRRRDPAAFAPPAKLRASAHHW